LTRALSHQLSIAALPYPIIACLIPAVVPIHTLPYRSSLAIARVGDQSPPLVKSTDTISHYSGRWIRELLHGIPLPPYTHLWKR